MTSTPITVTVLYCTVWQRYCKLQHTGSSYDDVIVTVETTFSQFVGGYVADLMLCEFDSGKEYKNLHTIEVHTKLRGQGSGKE